MNSRKNAEVLFGVGLVLMVGHYFVPFEMGWLGSASLYDIYQEISAGFTFVTVWIPMVFIVAAAACFYTEKKEAFNILSAVGMYALLMPEFIMLSFSDEIVSSLPVCLCMGGAVCYGICVYFANISSVKGLIICTAGELQGNSLQLRPGESVIIGRDEQAANLIVTDSKVSRRHCIIRVDQSGRRVYVTDVSTNGIIAGKYGKLVRGVETEVESGTVIELSNTTKFKIE